MARTISYDTLRHADACEEQRKSITRRQERRQREKQRNAPLAPVDSILRFEGGQMDEEEAREFLSRLRDSGLLFQLQGFYGRAARDLGVI